MNYLEKIPWAAAESNPIFLDIENENKIQIQSQTSFLVVDPTKNWKWIRIQLFFFAQIK